MPVSERALKPVTILSMSGSKVGGWLGSIMRLGSSSTDSSRPRAGGFTGSSGGRPRGSLERGVVYVYKVISLFLTIYSNSSYGYQLLIYIFIMDNNNNNDEDDDDEDDNNEATKTV